MSLEPKRAIQVFMWFLAYFLLQMAAYSLLRLQFLVWNWKSLQALGASDLIWAFLLGLRFDLSVVALVNVLAMIGALWLSNWRILTRFWLSLFAVLNAILLVINAADVELFNFTAKRFTYSSFFLTQDAQISNLITPYLGLASASAIIVFGYVFLSWKLISKFKVSLDLKNRAVASVSILVFSVVSARGGLQHKPVSFVDAKKFENSYANNLILNSTFTVLKTANKNSLEKLKYFDEKSMLSLLNNPSELESEIQFKEKPNIIFVILEGFSYEYSTLKNPEIMPFINKLRTQSADFELAYANGRRSIEGMAAILSGIPALMEEPFINSEFSANQVIGIGSLLAEQGYNSSFFHGANVGSMHFDSFTKSVGIPNYYGRQQYPIAGHDDGTWGIWDEYFLQWTCEKVSQFQTPFFASIFTLSSHQPFVLPPGEEYKGMFSAPGLPILRTIQYTDYSIEKFMTCVSQKPWYKNSLFVFVSDHTGPELVTNSDLLSRHRILLFLYSPSLDLKKHVNTKKMAQQIDILPTVFDLLGLELKNYNYLSRSLLRKGEKISALYSDNQYHLIGDIHNGDEQLKAIKQYFSEGMYDNRLYYPRKAE